MTYTLICQEVRDFLRTYDGPPFSAVLTDPPYVLTSIVERFGRIGAAPAQYGRDGAFARASRGFMGQNWDADDIAFDPKFWQSIAAILQPAAPGAAFAAARNYHLLTSALERAGLEITGISAWVKPNGMPKPTRIDTAIDRALGKSNERKVVGRYRLPTCTTWNLRQDLDRDSEIESKARYQHGGRRILDIVEPATDEAKMWAGHRYGAGTLKPAAEPIIWFRKPGKINRDKRFCAPASIFHNRALGQEVRAGLKADNPHPTLKSIGLTRFLAKLLREQTFEVNRILVPFCGSGSEMIGALLAGWGDVVGIEKQKEYIEIAEARLRWWTLQPHPDIQLAEFESDAAETDKWRQLRLY